MWPRIGILSLFLVQIAAAQLDAEECALHEDELQTCETCIGKGTKCFWCGGHKQECLPYEWYFPNCDLKDAKHNYCWVSTSAGVIVAAVACGLIAVILIACLFYCLCRCNQYRKQKEKARGISWNQEQAVNRAQMKERHDLRTNQRQAELEAYRMKYGLPMKKDSKTGKK
ncbi:unnamed protein product [Caenorhabditis auriculariae]|uniref:PSI domain-containing protein n=1 Tax=Caenorhabditis auriculariae TaxID=2777116 RepID=A0A8S1GY57_9PELO|nr:unnamed protein product [Caenorhabditis auriculariae]